MKQRKEERAVSEALEDNAKEWQKMNDEQLMLDAIEEITSVWKKVEEMAYILWEKSESIGEEKWWKSEWKVAVSKLKRAGVETPERPGLEEAE